MLAPLTLGLIDAQQRRITRVLADGAVLGNLVVSGLLVGIALGGYGTRLLAFLPHVPLEWAGIAIGSAGWLIEREGPVTVRETSIAIALAVLTLLSSAAIEIHITRRLT